MATKLQSVEELLKRISTKSGSVYLINDKTFLGYLKWSKNGNILFDTKSVTKKSPGNNNQCLLMPDPTGIFEINGFTGKYKVPNKPYIYLGPPFVQVIENILGKGITSNDIIHINNLNSSKTKSSSGINALGTFCMSVGINKIFYGAPGTGKSYRVNEIVQGKETYPAGEVVRTTFHPDTDYATFVGSYKPTSVQTPIYGFDSVGNTVEAKDKSGNTVYRKETTYKFVAQAFLKAYVSAWKKYIGFIQNPPQTANTEESTEPQTADVVYLVIEEINRGNCAQAFGDMFQLLDREDGWSKYHITPDDEIIKYLVIELGNDYAYYNEIIRKQSQQASDGCMMLPPNLYFLATMNTSDQSLFPMDSAFKRRWEMEYVKIDYANKTAKNIPLWFYATKGDKCEPVMWVDVLDVINGKIKDITKSNTKQMGEFFAGKANISFETFRDKVMFFLLTDALKNRKSDAIELKKDLLFEDLFDETDGGKKLIEDWILTLLDRTKCTPDNQDTEKKAQETVNREGGEVVGQQEQSAEVTEDNNTPDGVLNEGGNNNE